MSQSAQSSPRSQPAGHPPVVSRIAVGISGFDEGLDGAVLGEALARAAGAELLLAAVHADPLVVLPPGMDWTGLRTGAEAVVRGARDSFAPSARVTVETDISVARGLWRVVRREHRDLLVIGPSRTAEPGHVRIGKRTRQLLCGFECAVAVAPRGLHRQDGFTVQRIGVGYDGGPESQAALAVAAGLAVGAGAELRVRAAIDDRIRSVGWSRIGTGAAVVPGVGWEATGGGGTPSWDEVVQASERSLLEQTEAAAAASGANAVADAWRGRPANALLDLAEEVDLLVIGSRRWGMFARLVLGSTGEALLHDAPCAVLAVPRPAE